MKKICFVTGSRAEYGLLKALIKKTKYSKTFKMQLLVTGMHLEKKFGLTKREIEKDGFKIDAKINIDLKNDTPEGIAKSTSTGIREITKAFSRLKPDGIVLLGDRFETFSAAISAMFLNLPKIHIHGGELTESMIDDTIRHSITKMSNYHFVANEIYKKRVIQLGENPKNVFCVGGLGVDNINTIKLKSKQNLQKELRIIFGRKNLLITFHPVTLEIDTSKAQIIELLKSLEGLKETKLFFTAPNADIGNKIIFEKIQSFVSRNSNSYFFESLGVVNYLSFLKYIDALVGNSSSGILEVPSFKKATINIGDRQKGRLMASSVINVKPIFSDINKSLKIIYNKDFKQNLERTVNPYGEPGASDKILKKLSEINFSKSIVKTFYDLKI